MKIGLLDIGQIETGSNSLSTIHESIEMAVYADELGFKRYWLAEHYENDIAWRNPELIINLILGYTSNIRVGAAGVSLPVALPTRVAMDYKLLSNLYPNRVDLGIAKGTLPDNLIKDAMDGRDFLSNISLHQDRIKILLNYLNDTSETRYSPPYKGIVPEFWLLGSSDRNNKFIVTNKTNFSLSLFHTEIIPDRDILGNLRQDYIKQNETRPLLSIALSILPNNTTSLLEKSIITNVKGTESKILREILKLKSDYNADEIIILILGKNLKVKRRMIKLLSNLIEN